MGKGGGKQKKFATDFHLGMMFGLCHGPVDRITRVTLDEVDTWEGVVVGKTAVDVSDPDKWGGPEKEGGVSGRIFFTTGDTGNTLSRRVRDLIAKDKGLPTGSNDEVPQFRGVATAGFFGRGRNSKEGFYWRSNNPNLPPPAFEVTRIPAQDWYLEVAAIGVRRLRRAAVYLAIDSSGSMGLGGRLDAAKAAVKQSLNQIRTLVGSTATEIDVGVLYWSENLSVSPAERIRRSATVSDIDELIAFVDGRVAEGGTPFDVFAEKGKAFFDDTLGADYDLRAMFVVTDGEPTSGEAAALTAMGDLIDQETGDFNLEDGTEVDVYCAQIELAVTTAMQPFDNTPADGVPVFPAGDPEKLAALINAVIFRKGGTEANPAHIIYECLTDGQWGMGAPTSLIDNDSFRSAADTLWSEGLGLSMIWNDQMRVEDFVQEILNHIKGTMYQDPSSGRFVLKLIRNDYDASAAPVLTAANCVVEDFQRRSPSNVINEIQAKWTNPRNEKEETVKVQNLAAIEAAGGEISSDERNYYGVRDRNLAMRLASQDLRETSAPLATAKVRANRTASRLTPGAVFKLEYPDFNLDSGTIFRVVTVDYGSPRSPEIVIDATEDIYAFERPEFERFDDFSLDDDRQTRFRAKREDGRVFFTLNTHLFLASGAELEDSAYPEAGVGILIDTDKPGHLDAILLGSVTRPNGSTRISRIGAVGFVARGVLSAEMPLGAQTVLPALTGLSQVGVGPQVDGFAMIGASDLPETDMELALVTSFDGTNYTLQRGVLDTIPRTWPAGTPIRFFTAGTDIYDPIIRAEAETVEYKIRPRTNVNSLPRSRAPTRTYVPNDRLWAPPRPANVQVNGLQTDGYIDLTAVSPIPVSWANRNRLTEDSIVQFWDAGDVTPEAGQTTIVQALADDGTLISEVTGLSGVSYDLDPSAFGGASRGRVRVLSERDGFRSFTGFAQRVVLSAGYGYSYGLTYG